MLDVMFIIMNTNADALAAPKLLSVLNDDQKTIENMKGNATKLNPIATYGSGLKLCVSPSEIGNTKKNTIHITLNQNTPNATGRIIFKKIFCSLMTRIDSCKTYDGAY